MTPRRSIATVLFTDIVGSTERAAALGDRRWRAVLAQHHAYVREQLGRFGGHEIATAGDGFLAVFESPARAILCAAAIRGAIEELGLAVRCGLHLGEVERSDQSVGGIAVHIGARVAALAGANEILVSSTVRDAEAGSDFQFEDRGEHELKGMPGQWRLFAVTALPDDVEATLHEPVTEPSSPPTPDLWSRLRGSRVAQAVIAFALLFGLAGLYVVIKDRGRSFSPDEALAEAGPGIAVLPFQTTGPGLELWREGVIDLLSTNLDGAGGLRAIDSRTVLARWGEAVPVSARADLATALEAARRMGARYAIVGAAVGLGSQVSLTADVYEVDSGRSLGQTRVDGAPDSVHMLVDRLAIDILRTILGSEGSRLPRVNLARTMTGSLPALRAYLEGELHYRRADIPAAIEAYRRAVEADTTFALAYKRLAETIGWLPLETRPEQGVGYYSEQAVRYVDRLPEREAILVLGHKSFLDGSMAMLEPVKQATHRFPDDPELWYLVQEFYAHLDEQLLLPEEEKRRAFDRLLAMDPSFAPFYQHPIEDAFQEADSARTTTLLSRYEQLVESDSPELRSHRMAYDVAWGGPERRARALAAADTTDATRLPAIELLHPRFLADGETIAEAGREGRPWVYTRAAAYRGRPRAAFSVLGQPNMDPGGAAFLAYTLRDHGAPEAEWFRRAIPLVPDSTTGYATWQRGDRETALRELVVAQREGTGWGPATFMNRTIRWWIVRLLLELERPAEAEPYLLSLDQDPYAHFELGRLYERLGETAKARERYDLFVTAWRDADPELQPKVEEARQALTRLGFRPRG